MSITREQARKELARRELARRAQAQQPVGDTAAQRFSQGAIGSATNFADTIGSLAGRDMFGGRENPYLSLATDAGITSPEALQRTDLASVAGRATPFLAAGLARGPAAAGAELLSAGGAIGGEMAGQAIGGKTGAAIGGLAGAILAPFSTRPLKRVFASQAGAQEAQALRQATGAPVGFGEVGGSGLAQQVERISSRIPGGRGAAHNRANKIGLAIYRRADDLSRSLNPQNLSAEGVGQSLKEGFDSQYQKFQAKAGEMFEDAGMAMAGTGVRPNNLEKVLADIQRETAGSGQLAQAVDPATANYVDGLVQGLGQDLAANGGRFTYERFQALRRSLGQIMESKNVNIIGSPKQQLAERLWGATQKDMDILAAVADQNTRRAGGTPNAVKSMNKARDFYREGIRRVQLVNKQVMQSDIPSKIAEAAYNAKGSPEVMRALRDSVPKQQWEAARGMFIERMGLVGEGTTTAVTIDDAAAGLEFGMQQFLTNFSKIRRKGTIDLLFPGQMGADLTQLAKVMRASRQVIQRSPNMSGTAQAAGDLAMVQGAAAATWAGYAGEAVKAISSVVGAGAAGQWLTSSPKMINWVARSTAIPVAQLPQHLEKLFDVVREEPHTVDVAKSIVEQIKAP